MSGMAHWSPRLALILVVGLSACTPAPQAGAEGSKDIEIVATEMRFSPNRIDARVGQAIHITIVNRGSQRHDFAFQSIDMPGLRGVETLTMPGQSTTVTLNFDTPGTFPFLCTIEGHAASGMTGAVFVSP